MFIYIRVLPNNTIAATTRIPLGREAIQLWDLEGNLLHKYEFIHNFTCIASLGNGNVAVGCTNGCVIKIRPSGLTSILQDSYGTIQCIIGTYDQMITASSTIKIWNVIGKCVCTIHDSSSKILLWEGKIVSMYETCIKVWTLDGVRINIFVCNKTIMDMAVLPSGNELITIDMNKDISIWTFKATSDTSYTRWKSSIPLTSIIVCGIKVLITSTAEKKLIIF